MYVPGVQQGPVLKGTFVWEQMLSSGKQIGRLEKDICGKAFIGFF